MPYWSFRNRPPRGCLKTAWAHGSHSAPRLLSATWAPCYRFGLGWSCAGNCLRLTLLSVIVCMMIISNNSSCNTIVCLGRTKRVSRTAPQTSASRTRVLDRLRTLDVANGAVGGENEPQLYRQREAHRRSKYPTPTTGPPRRARELQAERSFWLEGSNSAAVVGYQRRCS